MCEQVEALRASVTALADRLDRHAEDVNTSDGVAEGYRRAADAIRWVVR